MSAPGGWHANDGEHTTIWSTQTRDVPGVLRDLADLLGMLPGALLISFYVTPSEGDTPDLFIVQAILTKVSPA